MSSAKQDDKNIICPHCRKKIHTADTEYLKLKNIPAQDETVSISLDSRKDNSAEEKDTPEQQGKNPTPKKIGRYSIIKEIARGGMGIVYLAEQPGLTRRVALKVLRAGDGASEEDLSRFMREAKAAASLSHPNIVPIHDLNANIETPFFTMDFIEGHSLEEIIAEEKITPREAIIILEQLAKAVSYAHSKGIIHRDLKPANVILTPGGIPKITDFGLAVNLAIDPERERMTSSGVVMGTIPYIPPEQAAGEVDQVGPHSDIYSLGAILYEMITGKPPFEGETQFDLLHAVLHKDPPLPRKIKPRIQPDLETICLKCLEKPSSRRYDSASNLAEDCRRFLDGEVITARPATFSYKVIKRITKHKALSLLGSGIILLIIISFSVMSYLSEKKEEVEKENKKTQIALIKETIKTKDQEKKIEELTASLDPGWKQDFFERFKHKKNTERNWSMSPAATRLKRGYLVLTSNQAEGETGKDSITTNIAYSKPLTHDCRIEFKLYLPKIEGYGLKILLSGNNKGLSGNFGYLFKIGTPADAGASISKGPVTLEESPNATVTPEKWHLVAVERNGSTLKMEMDGKVIIEALDESPFISDEFSTLGFILMKGLAYIDDVRIFRPGSSQQMMANMLDMADKFFQHNKLSWSIQMSEYVALETSDPNLFLRSIRRNISCYLRRRVSYTRAKPSAANLIQKLKKSPEHKFLAGEDEYILGLLAREARNYPAAIKHFSKAAGLAMKEDKSDSFILLSHLEALLANIKNDQIKQAVMMLTAMQRNGIITRIGFECKDILPASDTNSIFLAEVDRLIEIKQKVFAWNFLEALKFLFPENNREIAGRYLNLSKLYEDDRQINEAHALLKTAQLLAPEWEDPVLETADLYTRENQHRKALTLLEKAAIDFNESPKTQMKLAHFLLNSIDEKNPEMAVDAALRAVTLTESKNAEALDLLADAYSAVGEIEQAYLALINAQELSPAAERKLKIELLSGKNPEF
ncbi:MAG: protein kinase domain-containing protein [Planctomycetota bacterium]|jgi:serine/threonine protein kinase/Flp pilus assembly protein TadD